jgi:hypothetical protein
MHCPRSRLEAATILYFCTRGMLAGFGTDQKESEGGLRDLVDTNT